MNPHDCEAQNTQEVENSLETAVRIELCGQSKPPFAKSTICWRADGVVFLPWGNTGNSEEVVG